MRRKVDDSMNLNVAQTGVVPTCTMTHLLNNDKQLEPNASADLARTLMAGLGVDQSAAATEETTARPQPNTLLTEFSGQCCRTHWTMDARKLKGNDKQAVSPAFELSFGPQCPSATFKMIVYPKVSEAGKGGSSFKKSNGRGFVNLKCEGEIPESVADVRVRFGIGSGVCKQDMRGPIDHNFCASAICGLDKEEDVWDLRSVLDSATNTLVVSVELVSASFHAP